MITQPAKRVASIDILRGIVMVIMALDHARDFFTNYPYDPLDLDHTSTALFFTRWITHFCAPVFVFLAGTSAFLSLTRGKTKKEAALLLLTRGIWLIIVELTIVRFGWAFNVDYHLVIVQVIWAIGWSMIVLSALIFLPIRVIAVIGLVLIFGHNALDSFDAPASLGDNAFWDILHKQQPVTFGQGYTLFVIYPLVPWIGVMAMGYVFGTLVKKEAAQRNRWFYGIGISAILLFILLRWTGVYGEPVPREIRETGWRSFLSFLKCTKYPPSLLYLLMTLGPAILSLPLLERLNNGIGRFFTVYGRVPMFYYILHIYLLHGMALITGLIMGFPLHRFTGNDTLFLHDKWGFSLIIVYAYWLLAVLILYLPCRWYMQQKLNNKTWWHSYL
ncbi:MAG: DUF1624 domain-containing protein [Bacteroidetes bacterium]|nr:DUF1624 domain-containing protein [Bacteroidota bacterium]